MSVGSLGPLPRWRALRPRRQGPWVWGVEVLLALLARRVALGGIAAGVVATCGADRGRCRLAVGWPGLHPEPRSVGPWGVGCVAPAWRRDLAGVAGLWRLLAWLRVRRGGSGLWGLCGLSRLLPWLGLALTCAPDSVLC